MGRFRNNSCKLILLLFGCTAIGYNLTTMLHELGHALSLWLTGGRVERITLNPFSWSCTYYAAPPTHPILTSCAGALSDMLLTMLLMIVASFLHYQLMRLMLVITGIVAIAHSGIYAIIDTMACSGGDPTTLIQAGVSQIAIFAIGALLIAVSIVFALYAVQFVGFQPGDSLAKRIVVLESGLLPYLIGIVVYQAIYNPQEIGLFSSYSFADALFVLLIAGLSQLQLDYDHINILEYISWRRAWMTVATGISVILIELLLLP